ncbi:beta propeller repeat protein [Paenibacillus alba]|uniref:Photosynthesis system II assembly factor Ycf48/Hcf136-like domain-containing protein n=1 Tax=Paenibacillus alba TaxID=1197127 RepID=A0ABU6G565_9BACL|nr:hypothetical protein [Paenibacillus alba]MEC0229286.1 hypothetical protein [Paenibacillus alba]
MLALMSNKKLVFVTIFLLCAGCIHEGTSPPSPSPRPSLQTKSDIGSTLISGQQVRVNTQVNPVRLTPTKALSFVDELHGYGLAASNDELTFLQTSDGGLSWQAKSKVTNQIGPTLLSFLDTQIGWMFTGETGTRKSELRLTSDEGQTWEVIAQDLPGLEGSRGTPYFRFFDRQKGLLAVRTDKDLQLIRTQDGGLTWGVSNRIPFPSKEDGVFTFLSSTEGWFVGPSKKDKETMLLYHMTDGETWEEAGKWPSPGAPQAISFSDAQNGFLLIKKNNSGVQGQSWQWLQTRDGGKTWSQNEFPGTFQPLESKLQVSFPTSTSGWLWDARDLWGTADGGLNWHLLTH